MLAKESIGSSYDPAADSIAGLDTVVALGG